MRYTVSSNLNINVWLYFFNNINVHKETKKVEELQNLQLKQVLPISFKMGILTDKFLLDV